MPLSPDGHWAWDGQRWIPAPPAGPPPAPPAYPPAYPPVYPPFPGYPAMAAARPIGPAPGIEYASWALRAGAALIDMAIFATVLIVSIGIITASASGSDSGGHPVGVAIGVLLLVLGVIAGCVYQVVLPAHGGTWGMRALHLRVARADTGANIGIPLALGRWAVFAGIGFIPFGSAVDLLWPLWDERRQTLHDKAVNTLVVRPVTDAPGVSAPGSGSPAGG
ncbi:MAG TPA: RDD family protein [Candidatus Dormibacteraeota bacterium]|nr:RDD family protein [Candidatus Dormibacteraeota bacterium]